MGLFLFLGFKCFAQETAPKTLFIPRLEMFSTTYEIAFRGPAYIPLELEVKPKSWKRFSMYFVVGGYHQISDHLIWSFFPRPTTRYKINKGWQIGLGGRFYTGFLTRESDYSPQGIYFQPTFNLLHRVKGEINPQSTDPDLVFARTSPVFLGHVGYQKMIGNWALDGSLGYGYNPNGHLYINFSAFDYLQPRISIGYVITGK